VKIYNAVNIFGLFLWLIGFVVRNRVKVNDRNKMDLWLRRTQNITLFPQLLIFVRVLLE